MTQNELTYMLTIAEYGNISKAAQALYIAQPSLSEALAKIELELEKPLFVRTSSGLLPTEFGTRYLDTASQIKARYLRMLKELEDYRSLRRGSLTFGIPLNLGTHLLPEILPPFFEMYPDIAVQFKEANSTELYKLLLSGKIDFSIMHEGDSHARIACEFLSEDAFYLVMPSKMASRYAFLPNQILQLDQLKQLAIEPFLMVASRQKLRLVTDSILEQIGFHPLIRYTTKSMETAKRLAAKGMGITILPASYLHLFSDTENLSCFPLPKNLHARWNLVVAYSEQHPPARSSLAFIRLLKQTLATKK